MAIEEHYLPRFSGDACDVLFVMGGLLCSIVPDYRLIVVGRTLTGIGIGAVLNCALATTVLARTWLCARWL